MRRARTPQRSAKADRESLPLLVARAIGVQVGKRQILSGVDLEVDTGQVVAVLGSSGSGKTTLLSCLGGLREPSSGTVVVDGRPLSRMRARERARTRLELIGFVYQHADLLPELSPIENVMLPMDFAGAIPADRRRERAEQLLERLRPA
jgi:lipoprotein-releasing system ATP-binding protein